MKRLPPLLCVIWTLTLVATTVVAIDALRIAAWCAIVITIVSVITRQSDVIRTSTLWLFPLLLPLIVIHSFFNPTFPVTSQLWGTIPFRSDGIVHAINSGSKLMSLMIAAVLWRYVDAQRLFNWLVLLKCPVAFLVMFGQSHGMLILLRRRAENVFLAQRARGIAAGPGIFAKVRALPSVILPVVLNALGEADVRAVLLASRGFGAGVMTVLGQPGPRKEEMALSAISVLGWAVLELL